MSNNQRHLSTRIQLKIDTEYNWSRAVNFVPLQGEIIIYSADASRPFSRLKVGDGVHTVSALQFIDAGSVNGRVLENIIQTYNSRASFPFVGEEESIYVNLADNQIYCWVNGTGYTRIGNLTYTATSSSFNIVDTWDAGVMSSARVDNHILKITNGRAPALETREQSAVTRVAASPIDEGGETE